MMSQKKNDNNIPNYYLYGTVLTRYGLASLNHDIRLGNKQGGRIMSTKGLYFQ